MKELFILGIEDTRQAEDRFINDVIETQSCDKSFAFAIGDVAGAQRHSLFLCLIYELSQKPFSDYSAATYCAEDLIPSSAKV